MPSNAGGSVATVPLIPIVSLDLIRANHGLLYTTACLLALWTLILGLVTPPNSYLAYLAPAHLRTTLQLI